MKFRFIPVAVITVFVFAFCFAPAIAFADCDDLKHNVKWQNNYTILQELIRQNRHEEALATAKTLFGICMEEPMLYLSTGIVLEKMGEETRAKKYFYKASELAAINPTPKSDAKRIWYKLYETEHPNGTPNIEEEVSFQKDENEKLRNLLITTGGVDVLELHKNLLWAGTGIGAGGILLTIVGAILVGTAKRAEISDDETVRIKGNFLSGYTLLGLGIGFPLSGAALAGYSGYYVTHANKPREIDESDTQPENFDLFLGLGHAGFSLTF